MRMFCLIVSIVVCGIANNIHAGSTCGYISSGPCPECDGIFDSCDCRYVGSNCLCRNTSGGYGQRIVCLANFWWAEYDPNGYQIVEAPYSAPCYTYSTCYKANGGIDDFCSPHKPSCASLPGSCTWTTPVALGDLLLLDEGSACEVTP